MRLLTRAEFRQGVFERDGYRCVVPGCSNAAEDAHHIIERRLWPDGGYYLENGASLCDLAGAGHHMDAEKNVILPQQLRDWIGIDTVALPPEWDEYLGYNKWGDVLWNGKHPRTYHFPESPGAASDDKVLATVEHLRGHLIVSEKLDGENTTMSRDHIHARSVDSEVHSSQGWVRNLWGKIRYEIPDGFRITGENMYAVHSIKYDALPGYFVVHGVWDGEVNLAYDEAVEWAQLLGLPFAPLLERTLTMDPIEDVVARWARWQQAEPDQREGFVVRTTGPIHVSEYRTHVGKWVRAGHVRTLDHGWRFRNDYEINGLKN